MNTETTAARKKIINTRFGELEYDPDKTLLFPEGLLGFAALRHFVVMPNRKNGPLFWIQSIEDPEIAFVLTDPTNFFPTYQVTPDKNECQRLGLKPGGECFTLAVVTVHADRQVTLNLQAPILYVPSTNRALQVVLENATYQVRTPLPEGKK